MPSTESVQGDRRARRPHVGHHRSRPRRFAGRHRECCAGVGRSAASQPRLHHGRRPRLGRPQHRADQRRLRQRLQRDAPHRPARRAGPGLHRGLRLGPVQPDAHGAAHRPVRHATDQQRLCRGCHHGFGDQPVARRDAGTTRRGRQDRRPGGLHDARRDPPERRLHDRLHGQVPRHGLDRRDRDQPRVRRELGRQPELARHLLLRHERPVQRLGRTGPGHVRRPTTPRSTSTRTSRRTATASATHSSMPSWAPTST